MDVISSGKIQKIASLNVKNITHSRTKKPSITYLLNSITSMSKSLTQVEERLLEWIKQRDEFKRGEIRQFGANLNIAERTLSDILNKFIDKNIIHRVKNGLYAKR